MFEKKIYFLFFFISIFGLFHSLEAIFMSVNLTSQEVKQQTKIKAIIFDFSGVVAITDKHEVSEFIAQALDLSHDEAWHALNHFKELFKELIINDENEIDYWQTYAKSLGKKLPGDWLNKLNEARSKALKEIPGMIDLIKSLKAEGIQTALLSNVRKSQAKVKKRSGLYEFFNPTILSYKEGVSKPDLKSYKLILNKLNMSASEVIFVDDKGINIAAAKSLGIDAIMFLNTDQLIEALKERNIFFRTKS